MTDVGLNLDTRDLLSGLGVYGEIPVGYSKYAAKRPPVGTSLGTAGVVDLDMGVLNDTYQLITLTDNVTFTTSNRGAGLTVTLCISAGAAQRDITWPSWKQVGGDLPTVLAAGKTMVVSVTFFDSTNSNAVASAAVEL